MLKGKNAVITGARRGIGRACAELFAEYGANVWACARTPDAAFESDMSSLAAHYGVVIRPVYFDLADSAAIRKAVSSIRAEHLPIDILVNNAGAVLRRGRTFMMTTRSEAEETFCVNFFAQMELTQYIFRVMQKSGAGSIVNVISYAALDGDIGVFDYSSAKSAQVGATKAMAAEAAPNGIRVNAVSPGHVDTDMGRAMPAEHADRLLEHTLLKRPAAPREIAEVIAFLASDRASYMTGQIVRVDGGM